MNRVERSESGFTLLELGVIILIVAMLAVFAVPKFLNSVESSKATEAFNYLLQVEAAQSEYFDTHGTYAAELSQLDVFLPTLRHFTTSGFEKFDDPPRHTRWRMTLTRAGDSAGFGPYTVVFDQSGFNETDSSIRNHPNITQPNEAD